MSEIKRIVVHCSDSIFGDYDFIKKIHVKENKWRDIGYNFLIYNGQLKSRKEFYPMMDGRLVPARPIDFNTTLDKLERGAHTYGFNSSSIGICLIGKDKFTPDQFRTLQWFYKMWQAIIPGIELVGHYKFSKKTCPNFNVENFKEKVNRLISIDPVLHGIEKF